PIDRAQHRGEVFGKGAAVKAMAQRRLIGKGSGGNDVTAPQLRALDAEFGGGEVDEPLHDEIRFRPTGAAIDRHRYGVGGNALDADMDRGNVVNPRRHARHIVEHGIGDGVGAEIAGIGKLEREELAFSIEGQRALGPDVARLEIGEKGFAAARIPFDGPAELARRPGEHRVFGIYRGAHAEAAADIAGDDADAVHGDAEARGHGEFDAVNALAHRVNGEALRRFVVFGEGNARLHRRAADALVEAGE